MNKILHCTLTLMAGVVLLASCQKEDHTVNLTAIVADRPNSNSKVYIDGNYGYWQHGDQVKINGVASANTYSLSVVSGGTTTATIAGVTKDNDDEYTAGYPASQVSAIDKGVSVTMTIPEVQYYDLQPNISGGSADSQRVVMPMVAYSEDGTSLKFHNVASLVRINLVNSTGEDFDLHYVTVTAADNNLCGTGTVSVAGLSTEVPSFAISEGGKKSVTLDCCATHPEVKDGENIILYLVVAPFGDNESRDRLNIQVLAQDDANKKYTFDLTSRESGLYIERNQIGTVRVEMTGTGVAADFWGQGREDCPFLITNQSDLEKLRSHTYDGDDGFVGNEIFYKQTANIPLSSWTTAIGTDSNPFSSNYDGGEYCISNIDATGLFEYAGGGSIKNLTVEGKAFILSTVKNYGTLVSNVSSSLTIQNCHALPQITVSVNGFDVHGVGGLVGFANSKVEILDCSTLADSYILNKSGEVVQTLKAGGMLGYNNGVSTEIKNCNNYSRFGYESKTSKTSSGDWGYYGGICGYTTRNIKINKSSNYGTMKWDMNQGSSDNRVYMAGILGASANTSNVTIDSCDNRADITNQNYDVASKRGGILAYSNSTGDTKITYCTNYNSIDITHNSSSLGCVGGIVGVIENNNKLEISNCNVGVDGSNNDLNGGKVGGICCSSTASKTIIKDCENRFKISCKHTSAGIIGEVTSSGEITISGCINDGSTLSGTYNLGGIVGVCNSPSTIHDCKNYADIEGTSSAKDAGMAGIVAKIVNNAIITIYNCYNEGDITSTYTTTSSNQPYFGGIIGYCNSAITAYNCANIGDISAKIVFYTAGLFARCIAGSSIKNCYSQGGISIANSGCRACGGITNSFGKITNLCENCYFSGKITYSYTPSSVGSICGAYNGSKDNQSTCTDCYSLNTYNITYGTPANYRISQNDDSEYVTSNSSKTLKAALNSWSDIGSYSSWVSTDDTELPHLVWEDPAPASKKATTFHRRR